MAFCPFLSTRIKSIPATKYNVEGVVYDIERANGNATKIDSPGTSGWGVQEEIEDLPWEAVFVPESLTPENEEIEPEYEDVDCQEDQCALWYDDGEIQQCGLVPIPLAEVVEAIEELKELVETVIGEEDDLDEDGESQKLSLVKYLQHVIGKFDELDNESTLSLTKYLQNVLGKYDEIDTEEIKEIGSLLKTKTHIHNNHWHEKDDEGEFNYGHEDPLPDHAINLLSEFTLNQDKDFNRMPAGASSSIYGKDWMIDPDDPDLPPALKPIHSHPDWEDPDIKISWADYLALWD